MKSKTHRKTLRALRALVLLGVGGSLAASGCDARGLRRAADELQSLADTINPDSREVTFGDLVDEELDDWFDRD